MIRQTHTVAELEISRAAYDEIAQLLRTAGYDHVFDGDLIDMTGIGLTPGPGKPTIAGKTPDGHCVFNYPDLRIDPARFMQHGDRYTEANGVPMVVIDTRREPARPIETNIPALQGYELQGSGYDQHASGYELQGRARAPFSDDVQR